MARLLEHQGLVTHTVTTERLESDVEVQAQDIVNVCVANIKGIDESSVVIEQRLRHIELSTQEIQGLQSQALHAQHEV